MGSRDNNGSPCPRELRDICPGNFCAVAPALPFVIHTIYRCGTQWENMMNPRARQLRSNVWFHTNMNDDWEGD